MPLLKSSELTSGRTFRRIRSPAIVGVKFSRTPNSLNCDRHLAERPDDRDREFAAGEEARLLAVVGDQVRLGEALEIAGLLQRRISVPTFQLVLNRKRFRKSLNSIWPVRPRVVEVGAGELLRRAAADPVTAPVGAGEERRCPARSAPAGSLRRIRTCSITCWLGAARHLQHVDDVRLGAAARAISPSAASSACSTPGRTARSRRR